MAARIPNLFHSEPDAKRLYQLYLARLLQADRNEGVVTACRTIRRHARQTVGRWRAAFTFELELIALCELKQWRAAWRQLLAWDRLAAGRSIDIRRRRWKPDHAHRLIYIYAPLLYLQGRFRLGRDLAENGFDLFARSRWSSFELLYTVYKPLRQPRMIEDVTLRHFYDRLDLDLRRWRHWERFVQGFHPKLFSIAGLDRERLLRDPRRLSGFVRKLDAELDRRLPTGVSHGEVDLVESRSKVARRQARIKRQRDRFLREGQPARDAVRAKLARLFPDL